MMNVTEQEAVVTVCLMAAFVDGGKSDLERDQVKRIADNLACPGFDLARLYQDVLMKRVSLDDVAPALQTTGSRQLAYEMAVCVCDADDVLNEAEKEFLSALRRALALEAGAAADFEREAGALSVAAVPPPLPASSGLPGPPGSSEGGGLSVPPVISGAGVGVKDAEADQIVQNHAILAGALELLPESLATMAIVPLQMKLVYSLGLRHGYTLDRRHIAELLGAAGVGLTSQVVEGYARKLLGGLLGRLGGGLGRTVGNQVASSAMTFATTWALGQTAQRYYAGGRTLSAVQLRSLFDSFTGDAKALHGRFADQIQARARNVNPGQLLSLVRGQ